MKLQKKQTPNNSVNCVLFGNRNKDDMFDVLVYEVGNCGNYMIARVNSYWRIFHVQLKFRRFCDMIEVDFVVVAVVMQS